MQQISIYQSIGRTIKQVINSPGFAQEMMLVFTDNAFCILKSVEGFDSYFQIEDCQFDDSNWDISELVDNGVLSHQDLLDLDSQKNLKDKERTALRKKMYEDLKQEFE